MFPTTGKCELPKHSVCGIAIASIKPKSKTCEINGAIPW